MLLIVLIVLIVLAQIHKVNMGTLANRLDKLDNKFGLIEREVWCSEVRSTLVQRD